MGSVPQTVASDLSGCLVSNVEGKRHATRGIQRWNPRRKRLGRNWCGASLQGLASSPKLTQSGFGADSEINAN